MEWTGWEMWVSNLIVDEKKVEEGEDPDFAESFARIETHYFTHCGFFHKENQLIEDVDKIRDIPATIVQGRYDVVCPIKSCWELHTACAQPALSRFRTAFARLQRHRRPGRRRTSRLSATRGTA